MLRRFGGHIGFSIWRTQVSDFLAPSKNWNGMVQCISGTNLLLLEESKPQIPNSSDRTAHCRQWWHQHTTASSAVTTETFYPQNTTL